jgi:two-component system, sensor histidine kinase ChiS
MSPEPIDAAEALASRIEDLERERDRLLTVIDVLHEISGTLHFTDILQAIARRLGDAFGLDRASIFLADRGGKTVRLVASYEDPSIRNLVVDLTRYPEIRRAMDTGDTVFIADAASDPELQRAKGALTRRKARSITVVPIKYKGAAIGVIFLRTYQGGTAFSESEIHFTKVIADLTARALRNAHRYETLQQRSHEMTEATERIQKERLIVLGYLQRLIGAFTARDQEAQEALSNTSSQELERLVGVTLAVVAEEAKG